MQVISYKSIPKVLAKDSKKIRIAGIKTLNTVAFDSLPAITEQAAKDMNFKKSVRAAMGFKVKRATLNRMEAVVASDRGWLKFHVEEGTRTPKEGWKFNGQSYLVVPVAKEAFTAKNRMKAKYKRSIYIVPDGGDALVFFRPKKSGKTILIATLEKKVKFHRDTLPDRVVDKQFIKKANRLFNFYLDRL